MLDLQASSYNTGDGSSKNCALLTQCHSGGLSVVKNYIIFCDWSACKHKYVELLVSGLLGDPAFPVLHHSAWFEPLCASESSQATG